MRSDTGRRMVILAVLGLVIGACGNAPNADPESEHEVAAAESEHVDEAADDHPDEGHAGESVQFAFGAPAEPSNADRAIEIVASDDLSFSPNNFVVSAGETIEFAITNSGSIPHDFTLGDQATQDTHEEEMAEGNMEHSDANAVVLEPGETKSLTWSFTESGTVLIGCHQPGHYAGGMSGLIEVES